MSVTGAGGVISPDRRTVLYLDIDDTLLRYPHGRDEPPVPARGAPEFLSWAFERFEVRWLTLWCRGGRMADHLVTAFCKMLGTEPWVVADVLGVDWADSNSKLNGIAWLEHVVMGRPFLWVEDQYGLGDRERDFLEEQGFADSWINCNVTEEPEALRFLLERLQQELVTAS